MIQIYNSLTNQKEHFKPIDPNHIKMYVCGITVYDDCHIGHARTNVAFDVVVRYLRYRGYTVTFVRNITDIDDKIINRANLNCETTTQLCERTIASMHKDFDALNIMRPDIEPKATETVEEIIEMIKTLEDKGYAYQAKNGDVYYRVNRFDGYGKLSKQNLDALQSGSRVDVVDDKESPLDFVLWKPSKDNEPAWASPWGDGRPGWHIECSAMSKKFLGLNFDIHGGGSDLRFPHHENEIAQSEAANCCHFANYWVHSGMVQVDAEKMSKSLNNFFTIKEVMEVYHPDVLRFFLVSGQYRSEINYSTENLDHAKSAVDRLYTALRGCDLQAPLPHDAQRYIEMFESAMDNDFNTPEALPVLFALAKEVNRLRDSDMILASGYARLLKELAGVLGLLFTGADAYFQGVAKVGQMSDVEVQALIDERMVAKKNRDFARADEIREQLTQQKITLEDTAQGTLWKRG